MRVALIAVFASVVAVPFVACSSSKVDTALLTVADAGESRPPTPAEWDRMVTRPDEASAKGSRTACKFGRGAMPAETLGGELPVDKDIPIETVIVLMQENRSFDSYFAHLGKYAKRTDIESAPEDTTNPTNVGVAPGALHKWQHAPHKCFLDTNHEWTGSHVQYDDGKMDGFFQTNQDWAGETIKNPTPPLMDGERALWWYDERDIPFYYSLASTFGIGDKYFCSLLGPTWPNRMFLYGATSFGRTSNIFPELGLFAFPDNDATIFDELEKRHIAWNIYTANLPGAAVLVGPAITNRWGRNPVHSIDEFNTEAAAGTLPPVVFVDPYLGDEGPGRNDEHPPAHLQVGQKFVSDVVHTLFKSPQWAKSALFITYDEHGGIYDHVPPPAACEPDKLLPTFDKGEPTPGKFDRLGARVPIIVVSPFAKKAHVSHVVYDHTSITRFIQAKFKLPALTARDANADALFDFFDFANPPFVTPPDIPEPPIDTAELDYCTKTFAK